MSLVGFKAQNHQQQLLARGPKPDVDTRGTDPALENVGVHWFPSTEPGSSCFCGACTRDDAA